DRMEWELPAEAMYLEFEKLPYGREVFKVGEADAERLTSQVKAILEVLEEAPSPSPAPDRAGDLAPRRALSCEADDPCEADQSQCENRVACLQKTWKTTPPPCLGPRMKECFKNTDASRFACVKNDGDDNCRRGNGGYTDAQTKQSVVCADNAGTPAGRSLEITTLHERVHQCDPTPPNFTPLDGLSADQRADSCESICFQECGGDNPDPEVCGQPKPPDVPITPSQCEF
ncbi:MAG: hypothetical protein HYT87_08900, partial [Nitrospirae bacterium]|nr:hypothetical protein [Nitrospirota bacterium]